MMTREEILAKSRNENKNMDERELRIINRARATAGYVGILLCILINSYNGNHHGPEAVTHALLTVQCGIYGVEYLLTAIQLKKCYAWFVAAAFLILALISANSFLGTFR